MKPRILTTLLICSATLTTTATPAIAAVTPASKATVQVPAASAVSSSTISQENSIAPETDNVIPKALINLGVGSDNQLADKSGQTIWQKSGKPGVARDTEMNGAVLNFDGDSAFYTTLTDDQLGQLKDGLTIEAYFKYDPSADFNGEHEIFSSQESGGFGLGVQNGKVVFYANDGSGYKRPSGDLKAGIWVHAVGVIDKNKTASLYLDGKLAQSVKMPGDLQFARNTKDLVLGGDAKPDSHVQSQMTGKIKSARLYSQTLNADQVAKLSEDAHKDQRAHIPVDQTVGTELVGPKQISAGAVYGLNVHARQLKVGDSETLSFDVVFNPDKFYYVDSERMLGGDKTTVNQVENGRLRITTSAGLSNAEFIEYAKTRLAHINLCAKKDASGKSDIQFEQVAKKGTIQLGSPLTVNIQAKNPLDYNGDGIVGAGDVALAPADKKAEVAAKAEIKPYKHVIVLTTDGGGNPWNPEGIYYAKGTGMPAWTTDHNLMQKRKNTYTMDLFNKQFAMSTTAHSVMPAISAQNYISMLHGRPWETLPKEYQGTNGTMGQHYFADFGKDKQLYPSVFKVLQKNNPTQKAAVFSEWGPIVNAIVEPDAAVKTKQSDSLKSFDDVADYIGTDDFQNTAMVYMQSDYMDGQGHGNGWYNDNYWNKYAQYDGLFKKVMDKLESTGHIHDTLVIANADHGGAGTNHGPNDEPDSNIFIALGGETVDSGRRLHGGSNSDITALVLNALQVPRASHMFNSNVFDNSAFLSQGELAGKKRNVETVKLGYKGDTVKLGLTNLKKTRRLNAVDMQIDLAGRNVNSIQTVDGVKVLRQKIENGILKLTVSIDRQPVEGQTTDSLATIKLSSVANRNAGKIAIKQAMAGTTDGTEVLVDLDNGDANNINRPSTSKPLEPSKPSKPSESLKPSKPVDNGSNPDSVVNIEKVISLHESQKEIPLYTSDLKKISNKALSGGSDWFSDKTMTKDGVKYYRVASNEWVNEKDAYEYTNISSVLTTPKDKITFLVKSNGEKITNRALAPSTPWATDRVVNIKGKIYYRVATNEFVLSDTVHIN